VSVVIVVIIIVVVVIVVRIENVIPPMMLHACHLVFGDLSTNHLAPSYDFLRLVGAGRAVLDGVVILSQVDDFLILNGCATAITRFLA
jgi:hypothetical protein